MQSYKPDNFPTLSVYFTVVDCSRSIEFYKRAFGFELVEAFKDDNGNHGHTSMRKRDAVIMFCPEGAYNSPKKAPSTLGIIMPLNMYIYCEDVDKLYESAMKAGCMSIRAPGDQFWGDRFCLVTDIDGYEWAFATKTNN